MEERGKEKEERREGGKGGRKEDIYLITSWVLSYTHTTPPYLNQFEQVLKKLVIIHCNPSPFISPNTIMFHLVFITVYT